MVSFSLFLRETKPMTDGFALGTGSLITTATYMRQFVRSHPSYKFDSVVSEEINYDLIHALDDIEKGVKAAPGFLPDSYRGSETEKEDCSC